MIVCNVLTCKVAGIRLGVLILFDDNGFCIIW